MSILGLSGEQRREESRLKQIFWPSINHAEDVDTIATQGFWVCVIAATVSFLVVSLSGHPLIGIWSATMFFLGGIGIRQLSIAASVTVFALYLFNKVIAFLIAPGAAFAPVGLIDYVVLAILLANVRGTVIAAHRRQVPAEESGAPLLRFSDTWRDKLCDQMPPKVWPWGRFIFFALVGVYLALSALGVGVQIANRHAAASDLVVR